MTPGLKGGQTSNLMLLAISLLEAASMRMDADDSKYRACNDAQLALILFESHEPLGVMAAKTVMFLNNRSRNFEPPFNLYKILNLCCSAINIERVKDIISDRAADITRVSYSSHAFPERDIISFTILHKYLPFHSWRYIYEKFQRVELPHFEIEIASILIAYVIAVTTAVTSGVLSGEIRDWIKRRREIKEKARQMAREAKIEEKLKYLLIGYSLRDFHLKNSEVMSRQAFNTIWVHLRNDDPVPPSFETIYARFIELRKGLPLELRNDTPWILSKLDEILADYLIKEPQNKRSIDSANSS